MKFPVGMCNFALTGRPTQSKITGIYSYRIFCEWMVNGEVVDEITLDASKFAMYPTRKEAVAALKKHGEKLGADVNVLIKTLIKDLPEGVTIEKRGIGCRNAGTVNQETSTTKETSAQKPAKIEDRSDPTTRS